MKIDNLPETEVTVEAIPDPRDTEITLIDTEQTSDKETSDKEKERNKIKNKKSPLSRMQRDFLCTYKLDFIQECIIDMIDAQKRAIEHRYAVQS